MSDTQTTTTPETPEISPEATLVETPTPPSSEVATPTESPRNTDRRPPRGDAKGRSGGRPGMREEDKEFKEEMLSIDRVTRVTAGGRQIRFRASIVIGDGKGRIGLGTGKAGEVQVAIEKAIRDAKKHLITFPIVNGTIPHDVAVQYKASGLYIHPAHPGTGIIAGGAVRKIFSVSGIKDIIAKQHGAPNNITNARVTLKALQALKPVALINSFAAKKTPVVSEAKEEKKTPAPKAEVAKKPVAKKPVAKKAPAKKAE